MGNKSRFKKVRYCKMSKSIIIIPVIWFLNRKKLFLRRRPSASLRLGQKLIGRPGSCSRLQVSYSTQRIFKRSVIGSEGWNHHDHASITINHEWNESDFFVVSFSAKSRLLCGHYNYIHPKL